MKQLLCTALLAMLGASGASAAGKADANLRAVLHAARPGETVSAWVFFADKGRHEAAGAVVPATVVTERSIRRRLKVRTPAEVVDATDLPVEQQYVDQVASIVARVRQRSKWFNGVSVTATREQLAAVSALPFVVRLEPVARFRRNDTEQMTEQSAPVTPPPPPAPAGTTRFNYGPSLAQLQQINVVALHDSGNTGQGVLVGVFDNGFRNPAHQVFRSLQIAATYDFVDHKVSVVPRNPNHGWHGPAVLSTIGGFREGQLIGAAFGATYILARTENDSSETPVEEDNWVAAIEWADSLGVEVTSTSLGYLTYDAPYTSWTWQQMNGNTTLITRAADMAVRRGIVVVNSAGNNGSGSGGQNTLNAPADGDSVLSIGAVEASGTRSSFSSVGPTTSVPPRIKPDVMAQGSGVRVASAWDTVSYGSSSGTSFSCPLAAGAVALILHARPNATPMQIAAALKSTASRASTPDNLYGWGIIDTRRAISAISPTPVAEEPARPAEFVLDQNYPNPFNPSTVIGFTIAGTAGGRERVRLTVYDLLGREAAVLVDGALPAGRHSARWDASGMPSGVYYYTLEAAGTRTSRAMILTR
jgi:hypothetical protein